MRLLIVKLPRTRRTATLPLPSPCCTPPGNALQPSRRNVLVQTVDSSEEGGSAPSWHANAEVLVPGRQVGHRPCI